MIELMAVLLVVLIVAAIAIPVILKTGRNARLRSAGRQVNVFLRAARHRAITEGHFAHVHWGDASNVGEACIEASFQPTASLPDWDNIPRDLLGLGYTAEQIAAMDEKERAEALDPIRISGTSLPKGYVFQSADSVTFYPDGGTGGTTKTIVIQDQNNVQRQVSVTVHAGAGLIEMGIPSE